MAATGFYMTRSQIDNHDYRVSGRDLGNWNPQPEFWHQQQGTRRARLTLPVAFEVATDVINQSGADCKDGPYSGADFAALLRSDCVWLSFMVEIDKPVASAGVQAVPRSHSASEQQ